RVAPAGAGDTTQLFQRAGHVAAVDGVGEVPRSDGSRLAEERSDVVDPETPLGAVAGDEDVEHARQAADVVPEMLGQKLDGGRLETGVVLVDATGDPRHALASGRCGSFDDLPNLLERVDQAARHL